MPQRGDLKKILILGSGPIVIGQACEFDYSGTQACKALRKAGYEIILINSNPASIMTDPEIASKTYIEPLTSEIVSQIILREKPDAILPTMGGQTALNLAVKLSESNFLKKNNVELIGADLKAINKAEDRKLFKESMEKINVNVCPSGIASNLDEASSKLDAIPDGQTFTFIFSIDSLNNFLSSALLIAFKSAPINSTLFFFKKFDSDNLTARFKAVWPPIVGRIASGFSLKIIWETISEVKGSIYVLLAISGSVIIDAGFEFIKIIS